MKWWKKRPMRLLAKDGDDIKWVLKHEKDVDQICHTMESFLESIPGEKLGEKEQEMLEDLKHLITDIERVGDHANNLAEFAREIESKKHRLSKYGQQGIENHVQPGFKNLRPGFESA